MLLRLLLILFVAWAMPAWAGETHDVTDDAGRRVTVPVHPLRIAALHDIDITIPLIELGVMPVASHGRLGLDGKPYLRSSALLTGVDFATAPIAYLGATDIDLEALVAATPDLIITSTSRATPVEELERIAPTVVIDATRLGAPHVYQQLAALTGTEGRLALLDQRYRSGIELLKQALGERRPVVSVIQPLNGKISVYHSYRSLGRVLRDAGVAFPPLIEAIPPGGRIEVSGEKLPELDADVIFDPYRTDSGATSAAEIAAMERVVPGFCRFLKACRAGRYIMISREAAISNSYAALALMTAAVEASLTPRPTMP